MSYDDWLTNEPEPAETYDEACEREDAQLEQAEARAERQEES